jgi:hypothetical protein
LGSLLTSHEPILNGIKPPQPLEDGIKEPLGEWMRRTTKVQSYVVESASFPIALHPMSSIPLLWNMLSNTPSSPLYDHRVCSYPFWVI